MASVATISAQTVCPSLSAGALIDIVELAFHSSKSEWVFLRELRVGTGHHLHARQRLDAFALNCLPYLAMKRVCYEVKTSRGDLLSELRSPRKRRMGLRFSNEFYFVTPPGMIALDELPIECGLIEAGVAATEESKALVRSHNGAFYVEGGTGRYAMVSVPAPWRDSPAPTWQFAAAMMRNYQRAVAEKPLPPPKQQKLDLA